MNLKEIKEMINLMNESGLTEIELERDGLKIRLRKGGAPEITPMVAPVIQASVTAPAESAIDLAKSNLI